MELKKSKSLAVLTVYDSFQMMLTEEHLDEVMGLNQIYRNWEWGGCFFVSSDGYYEQS